MSKVNDGVRAAGHASLKAAHDELNLTGGDSWSKFYGDMVPDAPSLGDAMAEYWGGATGGIYRRAVFALDARKTPGRLSTNVIQDLSPNALSTASGSAGSAAIVQDGQGGKALRTHRSLTGFASTPDAAVLDVTGDLDIRVRATTQWATSEAAAIGLLGKDDGATDRSFSFGVNPSSSNGLVFAWSTLGTAASRTLVASPVPTGLANGETKWARVTLDVDDGAGNRVITFYLSDDGTNWTMLGSPVVQSGVTSVFSGNAPLDVGRYAGLSGFSGVGLVHRAQVRDGIDGTLVADFDPSRDASYSSLSWTSATTGETWTVTPGGDDTNDPLWLPYSGERYVWLPSSAGNGMTVPDSASFTPTTSLDVRSWVSLDDWTPSSDTALIGHYDATGNQRSWGLSVWTSGTIFLRTCPDGITPVTAASTVATGATDGSYLGVRAVWDSATPSVTFYTRADSAIDSDTGWTALGTVVTGATVAASIHNSTSTLSMGPWGALNNILPNGSPSRHGRHVLKVDGATVFDWNADRDPVNATHTAYTASSGQTVTVNRATSGRKSVVVEANKWLLGTDDYIEVADNALLDIDAATDFTVLAVVRQFDTPTNYGRWVTKEESLDSNHGWIFGSGGTSLAPFASIDEGGAGASALLSLAAGEYTVFTAGALLGMGFVIDRTAQTMEGFQGGVLNGTTQSISAVGDVSVPVPMRIGRGSDSNFFYQDFELYAVYIWREALSAAELAAIAADWGAA